MPWYCCNLQSRPLGEKNVVDRFDDIFKASGDPVEMMLVKKDHGSGRTTLWLRLPDEKFRASFLDFEVGTETDLPERAKLLIGHLAEFNWLFKYDT